jgi:uncharacterized protein (DUF885 family)
MPSRRRASLDRLALVFVLFPVWSACKSTEGGLGAEVSEAAASIEEALSVEPPRPVPASVYESQFDQIFEIYLDTVYRFDPPSATRAGVHTFDGTLGDPSPAAIAATTERLRGLDADLDALDPFALGFERRIDRELLLHRIRADVLDLQTWRAWERDPNFYLERVTEGVFTLLSREFAPPSARAASLVSRSKEVPGILATARRNLKNPPKVWTEVAIEQTEGAIEYLGGEAAQAFPAGVLASTEDEAFRSALAEIRKALRGYLEFLEDDLRERSHGGYAYGEENFLHKLYLEERVSLSVDRLLRIGEDEIARLEERFVRAAREIDPSAPPERVLERLAADHPPAEKVVEDTAAGLEALRRFCETRGLVTIPGDAAPIVRPTPSFRRALTFASMDMPGPSERVATESFYNVTLPGAGTSPEKAEELLRFFDRASMPVISAHEAYPGHFTHFLYVRRHPSPVRRVVHASTNAEGWAHYVEEMILEQGFEAGNPALRLAMLRLALVRACRFVVGIRLHTRGMTLPEATRFFADRAHLEPANAEREARRGTADPTYLAYTLGKLMILKLRDDVREARGTEFDLREFHDDFLRAGAPPIPIVRTLLVPGDSGAVL